MSTKNTIPWREAFPEYTAKQSWSVPKDCPEVFEKTGGDAALAAGIFHRQEVPISAVKAHLREKGIETR